MKQKLLFALMLFLVAFQTKYPVILILQEKARGCDVIFTEYYFGNPKYYNSHLKIGKKYISPTIEQIQRAEKIFIEQYNNKQVKMHKEYPDRFPKPKLVDVKKHFKYYKRQYIGYIDNNNDTLIGINLMNFKHKRKADKMFEDWDKEIFTGFGTYYEKNFTNETVNLNKKKIVY